MNEEYLNLLQNIRDTLEEINALRKELGDLLDGVTLENLERIRDTLAEIKELEEDT